MPHRLRDEHKEWKCIDYQGRTVILNYTYLQLNTEQRYKKFFKIASNDDYKKREDITTIYMAYTQSAINFVEIEEKDVVEHPNLRWYNDYVHAPVLEYYQAK